MRKNLVRHTLLSLLSTSCLVSAPAFATPPQTLEVTPTRYYISGDGSLVYSYFTDGSGNGVLWTPTTGNVVIGDIAGGAVAATVNDMMADGSAAVGFGEDGGPWSRAFYWSQGTGFTIIPDLPGATGFHQATKISGDGSTVVGGGVGAGGVGQIFTWTPGGGLNPLAFGGGWTEHYISFRQIDINYDGSAIAGSGTYLGDYRAFHWDSTNGMTAIPLLPPGVNPSAYNETWAISGDGTTVVGYNEYQATGGEGFYWSQATGVIGMGFLGGDTLSSATYVNYDGSQAYGYSWGSGPNGPIAFRWTQADGPVAINQIMTDAGIDMTDFNIDYIWSASDDGTYLTGDAYQYSATSSVTFMANLNAAALTTPDAIIDSIVSTPTLQEQATQKTMSQIGQSLFAARLHTPAIMRSVSPPQNIASFNPAAPDAIAPAAGDDATTYREPLRIAGYVVGSINAGQDNDLDNWGVNGTAGFKFNISDDFTIGVGLNGSDTQTQGLFDSHTSLVSKGGSILTSYEPDSGFRLYSSLFAARLAIDTHRGYAVAGGEDYSDGKTDGSALGLAARVGWEFPLTEVTSIQPYLEAHLTKIKVDPYTETTGSFPASFSGQSETSRLGKVGVELQHQFSPTLRLSTQLAYVHMPSASSSAVQTSVGGLTFATAGTAESDPNWAEATIGAQWAVSDQLQLTAELNGRTGHTQTPQAAATFGLSYNF